jgi:sporulation protein YlmC with PRC-barrel domain
MTERFYRREELVGKEVYDAFALHVGTAKDVAYSTDGKTALVVSKGKKEETIPFQNISEIGDIILLKRQHAPVEGKATEPMPEAGKLESEMTIGTSIQTRVPSVPAPKTCPKCQRENKPTAKFCLKCGYKFA